MIGEVINNKYRIEARLGEGGMGIVYKARDINLDRTVALKVMRPDLIKDESLLKRFLVEAKALARLEHPNIVTVYELGELQGSFFIVMQYIDGITLAKKLEDSGAFPYSEALPIFKAMLAAIGYAHQFQIIHRDIKPSNVMLTQQGVVKVMDFGVAKIQEGVDPAKPSIWAGTPYYMSPEQFIGVAPIDRRSDIYSLGIVLYELLTGRLPFEMTAQADLVKFIVQDEYSPPRDVKPSIPKSLSAIVMTALAKKPEQRFQTAEEMLNAIEQFERETQTIPPSNPEPILEPTLPLPPKPNGGKKRRSRRFILSDSRFVASLLVGIVLIITSLLLKYHSPWFNKKDSEVKSATSKDSLAANAPPTEKEPPPSSTLTQSGLIMELAGIAETKVLLEKLQEYQQAMQIAVGNKDDFESPEGCYVFVSDDQRVLGVFQFKGNVYYAVNSTATYTNLAEKFSGNRAIWVQDYSVK